jgi:hypothetical protein
MLQHIVDNITYYEVQGKRYAHKIDAVLAANASKSNISWYFNDAQFTVKTNWLKEPDTSLAELYAKRARELREQFDYVVVFCSGGADSTNVALSFLENGIHIDEIVASAPISGLNNFKANNTDTSHKNTISETFYTQLPFIKQIAAKYPSVKITIHDYFDDILQFSTDDWLYRSEDWIHPSGIARYRLEREPHLVKLADAGKKMAFIYGIDKPLVVIGKSQKVYTVFNDLAINVARPVFDREYPNVANIPFYWSMHNEDMLVKQAHCVARAIFSNPSIRQFANEIAITEMMNDVQKRERHSKYERAIVPVIYPDTAQPIFQAEKPTKLFLGEHDQWFYDLHSSTRTFQMIASDTRVFYNSIDAKYLNSSKNGFSTFVKSFCIGDAADFLPKLI